MEWGGRKSLKPEHSDLFGLDIGSSKVKMVQLHRNGEGYEVTAAGIVDIVSAGNGGNSRQAGIVRAIRECLKHTHTQTRMAVCGLCGPDVAVRYFKFPSLPSEELEGAVLLEAAQVCPFNVNTCTVDYQLISDSDNSASGVLVAATGELIRAKKQLAENASVKCVLMDVDGLAVLNCHRGFKNGKDSQNGLAPRHARHKTSRITAILNVGNSYTTLAFVGDNGLPSIRDITYAGSNIIEQIAAENGLSTERVRRILCEDEDGGEYGPRIEKGLAKACGKLIDDVAGTLRYYVAQEKSAVVDKILVCGGFALVKGFVELLNAHLPATTVLWNPFESVPCNADEPCRDVLASKGPALAVAAGLAMRSI
jgi:type IV pilus assembly protein PilM